MTDTYEARGPHVPDVMTRQSPWVYVFVAPALLQLWLATQDPAELGFRINEALVTLLGAALFARHPDARRALPALAFGLGLLALGPVLRLVDEPVTRFIDSLVPTAEEFIGLSPAVVAYHVLTSLVGTAAVLYIGAGLADARRNPPRRGEAAILSLLVVIGLATVLWQVLPIGGGPAPTTPYEWVLLGIGFVTSLLSTLAWSYLIAVMLGGWIAREQPRLGWGLALAGGLTGLLLRILNVILVVIGNLAEPVPAATLAIFGWLTTLEWLLVLAAFAVGLPATSEPATVDPPAATQPGSATG